VIENFYNLVSTPSLLLVSFSTFVTVSMLVRLAAAGLTLISCGLYIVHVLIVNSFFTYAY